MFGLFARNAPDPPHWTLNSCFGAFHNVWVHLGSFRNCMKLVAKHIEVVELMQKFVPGSRNVIFRSQWTHALYCTLNKYFGPFHSIWVHLGSFRNCMKLVAKHT